jgi:hypothetical protein
MNYVFGRLYIYSHSGVTVEGKGKGIKSSLCLTKHHPIKTYWGSGSIAPRFLWPRHWVEMRGQLHVPAALPQRKSPHYPLHRRLGGSQSRSGYGIEEKNSQLPPGIEPLSSDRPARSQSLYRLSYPGSSGVTVPVKISFLMSLDFGFLIVVL